MQAKSKRKEREISKNKPKPVNKWASATRSRSKRRAALQELNARREAEAAKLASIEKPTPKATTVQKNLNQFKDSEGLEHPNLKQGQNALRN